MKFYFVYSLPYNGSKKTLIGIWQRIKIKLINLNIIKSWVVKRKLTLKDTESWPVRSPYENTKNIYLRLNQSVNAELYDLRETLQLQFRKDDFFLGHPSFPILNGKEEGITEFAIKSVNKPKFCGIITPLHCDVMVKTSHINKAFLDHVDQLMPNVDILFAIMGEYWFDKWKESEYAHWLPKIVRLDMAVDVKNYKYHKKNFNNKGERKILYIGKNDPMKGTDFLSKLACHLPQYKFGWIGYGDDILGVERVSGFRELTSSYMEKIANEYDFFISPSKADPNPTTILESLAWGFPVLCTLESGYYENSIIRNIYFDDIQKTSEVIEELQNLDTYLLQDISIRGRELVMDSYNWDVFVDKIKSHIF